MTTSRKSLGVRLEPQESQTVERLVELFHAPGDAPAIHILMGALAKRSDAEIIKFIYGDNTPINSVRLNHWGKAKAGDWAESAPDNRPVLVSLDITSHLNIDPELDFIIEADGTSLESNNPRQNILDGSWLIMRKGIPSEGEVVLWRAVRENGVEEWCLKRHSQTEEGFAMKSGKGRKVSQPKDTRVLTVEGVKRGIIASV